MPSPSTPPTPPRAAGGSGRTASVVAGAAVALLAFAVLAAAGTLFWVDAKKGDDGFLKSSRETVTARGHAIATDTLDVNLDGADAVVGSDDLGTVRLQATPRAGKPLFVGIARTADVTRYLHGVAHAEVADVDATPFRVTATDRPGHGSPAPPATRRFWVASAHGQGTQTVDWHVKDGSWSVVVMNADGSAAVDAGVRVGADVPFLTPLAWGLAGGGAVLALLAALLLTLGLRGPSGTTPAAPARDLVPAAGA